MLDCGGCRAEDGEEFLNGCIAPLQLEDAAKPPNCVGDGKNRGGEYQFHGTAKLRNWSQYLRTL
jgi:hypothetical protein